MIIILIRTLILYTFVLISMRIMGKGELSEMQPFELVVTLMIAELAALPMEDVRLPLINGIVAIITILFAQIIISYLNLKSEKARKIICGKPSILINKGVINEKELKNLRINMNDLIEQLRIKNHPVIKDIEYAILETSGDLTVIPKTTEEKTTSVEGLPISLIIDGHIDYEGLKKINKDTLWLKNELKKQRINDIEDVFFCYIDKNKNLFVQKKE
ncbi:DUF421 domain-containing protein [Tepidibacter thalassicus]|uniref:Uncharacterized membrane protein YcaP, DUF421 family n=1 Tax=Tepidibacter thalassicus DSM 15285 TaxID=1123350 RepID=A0A1M5P0I8_9FIRM|nr:DUF421 domain-containing protein [Tepidibacter thalassicus]SHG95268.1 Uncharacterized membrane protein YcaP, DUF421 family [Tepidibacter thalassicus DSM 15285]